MDSNFTLEFQFYNISGDGCFQQQRHYRRYPYHTIAIFLINVFLCLAALFGNSAILVAIWKNPSLQSTANILLSSLAVTDFFVGLIAQPMPIVLLLTGMYGVPSSSYRFICLGFNYVSHVLCGSSLCIITAIGLDRFLALRLHLRYNSIVTSFCVSVVVSGIWICLLLLMINIFWEYQSFYNTISIAICVIIVANFVIYFKIHRIVRRHQVQIQHLQPANNGNIFRVKRLKKTAVNTFLVFSFLCCCYAPHMSVLIINSASFTALLITATLAFLNSSLNPLLYCWRVREIRTAIQHILCTN